MPAQAQPAPLVCAALGQQPAGAASQSGGDKEVLRWMLVWVHDDVNVLSSTQLYP